MNEEVSVDYVVKTLRDIADKLEKQTAIIKEVQFHKTMIGSLYIKAMEDV